MNYFGKKRNEYNLTFRPLEKFYIQTGPGYISFISEQNINKYNTTTTPGLTPEPETTTEEQKKKI